MKPDKTLEYYKFEREGSKIHIYGNRNFKSTIIFENNKFSHCEFNVGSNAKWDLEQWKFINELSQRIIDIEEGNPCLKTQ